MHIVGVAAEARTASLVFAIKINTKIESFRAKHLENLITKLTFFLFVCEREMVGDFWLRVGEGEVGRGVVGRHSWTDLNNS